ncbi:MAG: hypothetical protein K0S61_2467 [Anaerocolumna sp.]|jgi:hypothetical protein|nr:hypothetical protein [Anaerocolumna sp.]
MSKERPMIVTILGDTNTLGALLILLSLFPFLEQIGISFYLLWFINVSDIYANIIKVLYAGYLLLVSYGYLRLKKWGFGLLVITKLISILVWLISYLQNVEQLKMPYPQLSIISLIFIVPTYKYFYKIDST